MSSMLPRLFPPEAQERIKQAVHDAEKKTAGEIVPYVVERSDPYPEAEWRGGALLGALVLGVIAFLHNVTDAWLPVDRVELILLTFLAFGAGMLLVKLLPSLTRLMAGKELVERRVAQRAAEAFISEEVFHTRYRTGILVFVSLLERKVIVVGDSGINAKVEAGAWEGVVNAVVSGIHQGRAVEGLVDAISQCGLLLERHQVTIRPDDTDELKDDLRLKER